MEPASVPSSSAYPATAENEILACMDLFELEKLLTDLKEQLRIQEEFLKREFLKREFLNADKSVEQQTMERTHKLVETVQQQIDTVNLIATMTQQDAEQRDAERVVVDVDGWKSLMKRNDWYKGDDRPKPKVLTGDDLREAQTWFDDWKDGEKKTVYKGARVVGGDYWTPEPNTLYPTQMPSSSNVLTNDDLRDAQPYACARLVGRDQRLKSSLYVPEPNVTRISEEASSSSTEQVVKRD